MVKISMGSKLILLVFDKNNKPYNNVKISMEDFSSPSKSIDLLNEKGESLAVPIKTNEEGKVTVFLNKMSYSPPFKVTAVDDFKKIATESIGNINEGETNSFAVHFGLDKGTTSRTISGKFMEYPFDSIIQQMNGEIILEFKFKEETYTLTLKSNGISSKFGNFAFKEDEKNTDIKWTGWFDQGMIVFNILSPLGELKDCKVKIKNRINGIYFECTHSKVIPNPYSAMYSGFTNSEPEADKFTMPDNSIQKILIPFYHPLKNYHVTGNLCRFSGQTPLPIHEMHNATLTFNHHIFTSSGENNITHNIEVKDMNANLKQEFLSENMNQSNILRDAIHVEFSFDKTAGDYNFILRDVAGSKEDTVQNINEGELKIDYNRPKTHVGRTNGHTYEKFFFTNKQDKIPPNTLSIPNDHLIIPLNNWSGNFNVKISKRDTGEISSFNYESQDIQAFKIDSDQSNFTKLNFELDPGDLTYNDKIANIAFAVNIIINDAELNPVLVHLNMGEGISMNKKKENLIHSMDFHSGVDYHKYIFYPVPLDPLPVKKAINKNELLARPDKGISTVELSINFVKEDNKTPLKGTYYVLAEFVPVHYDSISKGVVQIDSRGYPRYAVFIINIK